ncbi:bifunctional allantoicase/(S)-ureidoglycine aminohydrolase [Gulosibacter sp. 10]|uniref:bifunctional allantoicase/(S)-ureidoglycine aminohydrolase n=1 Tax=Gulosibacter sp. 10 TaxID=1255570 RepID=UPI00097F5859|nr:bifunctional allantoicase/(S)-ureidoglycine aminohydrolase [Gulosibacter sp. 10]SJM69488.1 Ureidoglycine aminohydrolase [Gulosibacter sp. 10]
MTKNTNATYPKLDTPLPEQHEHLSSAAVVKDAYTFIPASVMRDIVASVLPEFTGARAWVLNRPVAGGATTFGQMLVELEPGGGSDAPEPQPEVANFVFVQRGTVSVVLDEGREPVELGEGGYAFAPAGSNWSIRNTGDGVAEFMWVRKRYEEYDGPRPAAFSGHEQDIEPTAMPGTDGRWATTRFMDPEDVAHDFHMTVVTFEPGAKIPFLETHVMEHGIYILEGNAVYRLNEDWIEMSAGDYFSLRAFCPQACYAGGPGKFRYLLYKDVNRQIRL